MIAIKSDDNLLIVNLISKIPHIAKDEAAVIAKGYKNGFEKISSLSFEHPFDDTIIEILKNFLPLSSNNSLYRNVTGIRNLWFKLVDKGIKCLRFFDIREPYLVYKDKNPQSYGIEELRRYYDEFAEFEALLYGSNQFYRDHVIHLFRTWLIGMNILINAIDEDCLYKCFEIEGTGNSLKFNFFECISMWTIAALCHDLGYPLEKFQGVINKTQRMMEYLVSQPKIQQDITFSGTQDKLNEYIIRLISSKMVKAPISTPSAPLYNARTQSKYYMKYSKSLEDYSHGIISAIIIYKSLLYFLESDFSLHEDYTFSENDIKQFYLRRDILRCIASHTCKDIYHMKSTTFPILLIISDDLQEWGRRRWTDFYTNDQIKSPEFNLIHYDRKHIAVEYVFRKIKNSEVPFLIENFYNQFAKFRKLFRDGQDTADRNFSFLVRYNMTLLTEKEININLFIPEKSIATFKIIGKGYKRKIDFQRIIDRIKNIGDIIDKNTFDVTFT